MRNHHNTMVQRIFSSDPNKTAGQIIEEAKAWVEFNNDFRQSNGEPKLPKDAWEKVVVPM